MASAYADPTMRLELERLANATALPRMVEVKGGKEGGGSDLREFAKALGTGITSSSGFTALLSISKSDLQIDRGTLIVPVFKFGPQPSTSGTLDFRPDSDLLLRRGRTRTRMGRIREIANLTLRQWAEVFGVSHTAISGWQNKEPDRPELDQILDLLREAAERRPALSDWLIQPLPQSDQRPIDFLREHRWRAFRGALRLQPAQISITPGEIRRAHQQGIDRAMADAPSPPDPE